MLDYLHFQDRKEISRSAVFILIMYLCILSEGVGHRDRSLLSFGFKKNILKANPKLLEKRFQNPPDFKPVENV